MSLQIRVSTTQIKPEFRLNGDVFTDNPFAAGLDVDRLSIRLLGISETRAITGSESNIDNEQESSTFLDIEKDLRTPTHLQGNEWTHPFQIMVPEDPASAELAPLNSYFRNDSLIDPLLSDRPKPQELPPSGEYGSGNHIVYSLEAVLITKRSRSELAASRLLNFAKTRAVEAPDSKTINTAQELRHNSIVGLPNTEVVLDSPQVVVQGRPFPLVLRLSLRHWHSAAIPKPDVLFDSCDVQLLEHTYINSASNTQSKNIFSERVKALWVLKP